MVYQMVYQKRQLHESFTIDLETTRASESDGPQKRFKERQITGKLEHVVIEFSAKPANSVDCYVNCVKEKCEKILRKR